MSGKLGLRDQVLAAALECTQGDPQRSFSAEDLLMEAWRRDRDAWGLRGYERDHPDSEKIRAELDRANVKGGMVGLGLLERVSARVYKLTPAGFARAASLYGDAAPATQVMAHRALADAIREILAHPIFIQWLKDPDMPKRFREAGSFWGIAAGTPPSVVRDRVRRVQKTLEGALALLEDKAVEEISEKRGKRLYERRDIERGLEFQKVLTTRFATQLRALGVED